MDGQVCLNVVRQVLAQIQSFLGIFFHMSIYIYVYYMLWLDRYSFQTTNLILLPFGKLGGNRRLLFLYLLTESSGKQHEFLHMNPSCSAT